MWCEKFVLNNLLPIYFFEYTFQQIFYNFSIPFKYYFFIHSLIFIFFFNISLCIPNYYNFLIPNNYIFKSPNGNIFKFFNNHTFQLFFLMIIFFIYQTYINLEIYQIYVIWNELMHYIFHNLFFLDYYYYCYLIIK